MNAHIWQFNWASQKVGFKLIASSNSFDAQVYDQDGAPVPVFPWPDRSNGRPLRFTPIEKNKSASQWQAWNYWIEYKNPYFEAE